MSMGTHVRRRCNRCIADAVVYRVKTNAVDGSGPHVDVNGEAQVTQNFGHLIVGLSRQSVQPITTRERSLNLHWLEALRAHWAPRTPCCAKRDVHESGRPRAATTGFR